MSQDIHIGSTFDAAGVHAAIRGMTDVHAGMNKMLATGARLTEMSLGTFKGIDQLRTANDGLSKAIAGVNIATNAMRVGIELSNALISEQEKRWDAAAAAAARANLAGTPAGHLAGQFEEAKKLGFQYDKTATSAENLAKMQEFLKKEGLGGLKLASGEAARDGQKLDLALKGLTVTGKDVADTASKITAGMKVLREEVGLTEEQAVKRLDSAIAGMSAKMAQLTAGEIPAHAKALADLRDRYKETAAEIAKTAEDSEKRMSDLESWVSGKSTFGKAGPRKTYADVQAEAGGVEFGGGLSGGGKMGGGGVNTASLDIKREAESARRDAIMMEVANEIEKWRVEGIRIQGDAPPSGGGSQVTGDEAKTLAMEATREALELSRDTAERLMASGEKPGTVGANVSMATIAAKETAEKTAAAVEVGGRAGIQAGLTSALGGDFGRIFAAAMNPGMRMAIEEGAKAGIAAGISSIPGLGESGGAVAAGVGLPGLDGKVASPGYQPELGGMYAVLDDLTKVLAQFAAGFTSP